MREAFRIAVLIVVMLAWGTPSAVAQRGIGAQGGRVNAGLGRQGNRFPNQRRLDRPPFRVPQLGRRPNAPLRRQEQKRLLQQRLMRAIGLRPDQQARMQQIRRGHDDEVIAAGRRLRQARRSLDLAIMNENYDEVAVRRATDELAAAQADKIKLDSRIRSEVRGVLTADQVMRFHQLERQMRQEMRQQNLQERERELEEPTTPPASRPPDGADDTELIDLLSSGNQDR